MTVVWTVAPDAQLYADAPSRLWVWWHSVVACSHAVSDPYVLLFTKRTEAARQNHMAITSEGFCHVAATPFAHKLKLAVDDNKNKNKCRNDLR
ncbi:hypothetical protein CH63R_02473 [Colletotrichum higginsianum IMI 349063]|uniref:Uncharacterized protein n=1 Tax=Colletotrichum higginsianum (strain IMI 349063) TaxID=759273 RepID=A0A1B7YNW1_COLHI|nr:hypothetical protein CH63R_02473 [Colletotrichum higginsianum IMI 349063]OBR13747.1 hypothetical protein CH63R_02473 [Colletotrichum higginsianum IMI 349063]